MITKEQAIALGNGTLREEIHFSNVENECAVIFGPRGGRTQRICYVRPNGKCQTWVTRPDEFRLPIKQGMYSYGNITNTNAGSFHLASECPALKENR